MKGYVILIGSSLAVLGVLLLVYWNQNRVAVPDMGAMAQTETADVYTVKADNTAARAADAEPLILREPLLEEPLRWEQEEEAEETAKGQTAGNTGYPAGTQAAGSASGQAQGVSAKPDTASAQQVGWAADNNAGGNQTAAADSTAADGTGTGNGTNQQGNGNNAASQGSGGGGNPQGNNESQNGGNAGATTGENKPGADGLRNISGEKITLTMGNTVMTVDLYDNSAANDLLSKLPLTFSISDYAGWDEKLIRLDSANALSMADYNGGDEPGIPEVGYYEPGNWIALYFGYIGYWPGKIPLGRIDATCSEIAAIPAGTTVVIERYAETAQRQEDDRESDNGKGDNQESDGRKEDTQESDNGKEDTQQPDNGKEDTQQPGGQESDTQDFRTPLQTAAYNLNGVDFKMILVDGGTFTMGSNERAQGGGTQVGNQAGEHQVTLSSYLIGETEVTRALWNEVMYGYHDDEDLYYPVASVTVPNCRRFVERLNQKAHAAGIIPEDRNFYIPTEAQWEFAAKGGNYSRGYTYAGSNTLSEVGWTSDDGGSAHMVKQKLPNELGIYDMSGNVYEWVADYAAPYSTEAQTDPCNMEQSRNYIKRGGSFYYNDDYRFTCTYRYFYSSTDYTIGLRIALH